LVLSEENTEGQEVRRKGSKAMSERTHDNPFDHAEDFIWRNDGGKNGARIAVRKPKDWRSDPHFDENQYWDHYRAKMILDSQWIGT
jgi:hypothetical protein